MTRTNVGTVEDLHASAVKACGLDDFGPDDDNYKEALGVLLEAYQRDADLTELGSKMQRFFVRNALVARLAVPGTQFVAVGAGHLVGSDSVQAMLAKLGYKAVRVE